MEFDVVQYVQDNVILIVVNILTLVMAFITFTAQEQHIRLFSAVAAILGAILAINIGRYSF
jgi:hypothetical protein